MSVMTAVTVPLLTSLIISAVTVSNNLIKVPFPEHVARIVPSYDNLIAASAVLCAFTVNN